MNILLICKKDYRMKSHELAFKFGKSYSVYSKWVEDGIPHYVVNSEIADGHIMPDDAKTRKHFDIVIGV